MTKTYQGTYYRRIGKTIVKLGNKAIVADSFSHARDLLMADRNRPANATGVYVV